ncbi:protein phosphatase 1G [Trichuris trichiura]|uniref:protein-serine/threonine phosphatase n=1 Tax=Trichuris trichiura TaxID=36087 RepID=A0A077ZG77_TRITR|nr:protein phosphatase 1G [Trichuris trichiura]
MGAYLSSPNTEKVSEQGKGNFVKYGAVSMQGWRISQEDAHNCILNFDGNDCCFFAVYDGHGGAEVAQFAAEEFPNFLKSMPAWKESNIPLALESGFLAFDEGLLREPFFHRLKEIAKCSSSASDAAIDDDERIGLYEDSTIAVEELRKRYGISSSEMPNSKRRSTEMLSFEESDYQKEFAENGIHQTERLEVPSEDLLNGPPNSGNTAISPKRAKVEDESETFVENNQRNCSNGDASPANYSDSTAEEDSEGYVATSSDGASRFELASRLGSFLIARHVYSDSSVEFDDHCVDYDAVAQFREVTGNMPGVDSGTTACVVVLRDKIVYVANVGDSRCVLCREGIAKDLSVDHKPEDEIEKARIEKAGGAITGDGRVNGGLNLSRAIGTLWTEIFRQNCMILSTLGDHFYKANDLLPIKDQMISALPDIKIHELEKGDEFLVIACDGIWNSMSSQEVIDFISQRAKEGKEEVDIAAELCNACLSSTTSGDGTGCDNMTVIVVTFQWNG